MTAFTVVLPHLRNPGNDAALRICLDCLMANTVNDFTLIMAAVRGGSHNATVNRMVAQADTDVFVYWSSDMFAAPGWDVPMLAAWNEQTLVTNVLVEPGAIGMHPDNVHKDFGRKPETFRRADFEAWAASGDAPVPDNFGWFAPYAMSRAAFLDYGGLTLTLTADHRGFTAADQLMFADWKASGRHIRRARSYTYHLQAYSDEAEQGHEKREMQAL